MDRSIVRGWFFLLLQVRLLGVAARSAAAGEPPAEIQRILAEQAKAWNEGDLDRFMEFYWQSPELTFSSGGTVQRGWQQTRDGYRQRYPTRERMGRVVFEQLEYQPLGAEAALVLGEWTLERTNERLGGKFTLVFRRIDGHWLIVHDHTSRRETAPTKPTEEPARPSSPPAADGNGAAHGDVRVTLLDEAAIHYATFQSHNQKVVGRDNAVYCTYVQTRNEAYTDQTWRLMRSVDGGRTFEVLLEETAATNPPLLEIDAAGNLYLFRVDFVGGDAFLDYWPRDHVGNPRFRRTTRIPQGAAGKYAAVLDEPRGQLYFFSHNNSFHRIGMDGVVKESRTLLKPGPHAILQYPQLTLDESGRLFVSWTTQKHGEYLYWDIHLLVSADGGVTFERLSGEPLATPIIADDQGPATRVTLDDEFTAHTWLSSSLARDGRWHGLYLAQTNPARQHYVRYRADDDRKEQDRFPELRGESIRLQGLDGFFVADRNVPQRLFVIGNSEGRVGCLVSHDAGSSWHDYALSEQAFSLYSLGGYRWVVEDGAILGTFTDQRTTDGLCERLSKVYFFRVESVSQ